MGKKQSGGRQKIEMKMIENKHARLRTFSKRKAGVFKKASELSTLCGVAIGVMFISPTGRPFSFAHPSIDFVCDKFLNQNRPIPDNKTISTQTTDSDQLTKKLNETLEQLESENEKGKLLDQMGKEFENKGGFNKPINELNIDELQQLKVQMLLLEQKVIGQLDDGKARDNENAECNGNKAV